MRTLTDLERLGIARAQEAVARIVGECPECLEGPALVASLVALLQCSADEANLGAVGIAAAAIAELVERDRALARGERSVAV